MAPPLEAIVVGAAGQAVVAATVQASLGTLLTEPQAFFVEKTALVCCLFFFLSPIVAVRRVFQTKGESLSLVNPVSLLGMFLNCSTNLVYAIYLPMPAAAPANVF